MRLVQIRTIDKKDILVNVDNISIISLHHNDDHIVVMNNSFSMKIDGIQLKKLEQLNCEINELGRK